MGASPPMRLYEAAGDHVQSFALDNNGLPAKKPAWQLYGGFSIALSVALDAAGYIYVSDRGSQGKISVFAPGSSGTAKPIRQIQPGPYGQTWIAVNPAGYLFVLYGDYRTVLVYAPGAGAPGMPTPLPIHTITMSKQADYLVADGTGRLYVTVGGVAYYYNDPVHHWLAPDGTISARGTRENYVYAPIAIDSTTGDVYFTTQDTHVMQKWRAGDHAARSLAIQRRDAIDLSGDCKQSGFGVEYSMAVGKNYLMNVRRPIRPARVSQGGGQATVSRETPERIRDYPLAWQLPDFQEKLNAERRAAMNG